MKRAHSQVRERVGCCGGERGGCDTMLPSESDTAHSIFGESQLWPFAHSEVTHETLCSLQCDHSRDEDGKRKLFVTCPGSPTVMERVDTVIADAYPTCVCQPLSQTLNIHQLSLPSLSPHKLSSSFLPCSRRRS